MNRKMFWVLLIGITIVFAGCSKKADTSAQGEGNTGSESSGGGLLRDTSAAKKLTRANGEIFPGRQVEIIVPLAPGGGTDIFIRQLAEPLMKLTGVPVTVTNITGANSLRGADELRRREPDGYSLIAFNTPSMPVSQLTQEPDFDVRNFTPISYYAVDAVILVTHPSLPFENFEQVKQAYNSGEYKMIGAGDVGSTAEVGARLLKKAANFNYESTITYNGSGDVVAALLRKELVAASVVAGSALTAISDGDLRPLITMTYDRFPGLPDTPSMKDLGYESIDAVAAQCRLIMAPPNMPKDIADYWESIVVEACKDPGLVSWAESQGLPILGLGAAACKERLETAFGIDKLMDLSEFK